MERCLYDPATGYYGSGVVQLSKEPHFWTYSQWLSPVFGWALAERVRGILEDWSDRGLLDKGQQITILELGGGDGCLGRDVVDYIVTKASDATWNRFSNRFEYVIGELSPALRARQQRHLKKHIDTGLVRILDCDARELRWNGTFKGVVICNELIDAFPVEKLRITSPGEIARVHVERIDSKQPAFAEELVPLSGGWWIERGGLVGPPTRLAEYLGTLEPLIADLEACGLLPADLHWPPGMAGFVESLGKLPAAPGNVGTALILDYGGTSRHVLDPQTLSSHLRVYGSDRELAHSNGVYQDPGHRDMTADVDFTEIARLAREHGLEVSSYTHQSALEDKKTPLDEGGNLEALADRLSREVGYAQGVARLVAQHVVKRFRRSPCYWLMELANPKHECGNQRQKGELQPDAMALQSLANSVEPKRLRQALVEEDLPGEIADRLKPCGDITADLSDAGVLGHLGAVVGLLEKHGWLRAPGAVNA